MTDINKLDELLKLIVNCKEPNRRSLTEVIDELEKLKLEILTDEVYEILDKLIKDGNLFSQVHEGNIAYYYSSFEGRLFLKNGGYSKLAITQKIRRIANMSVIAISIINIVVTIDLTYLNYRATDKANDNREEITKLNLTIDHFAKFNDSL